MFITNSHLLIQLGLSLSSIIIYYIFISLIKTAILKYGKQQKLIEQRIIYIKKFFTFLLLATLFVSMALIWGIDFRGVLIFASSFFAIVGIALFASWSILSNITSSVILFFSFPCKIGDKIKIIDGENSIEGKIIDMTMFSLQIEDIDGNTISYPNNLAMQKPILKLKQTS